MRALREQDARFSNERKRQLELAKLRREQRKLKQEDNFDTAAILLGMAKQERATREAKYVICTVSSLLLSGASRGVGGGGRGWAKRSSCKNIRLEGLKMFYNLLASRLIF